MKTSPALFLIVLPVAAGLAATDTKSHESPGFRAQQSEELTPGGILATQVREIAATKDLSARSKSRQIASAVRLAILTVTTNLKSADQALQLVLDLAAQAARAAPEFADTITEAVTDATGQVALIAGVSGLKEKLQDAVSGAVQAAGEGADRERSESHHSQRPENPEFGGRTDDVIVSPSH